MVLGFPGHLEFLQFTISALFGTIPYINHHLGEVALNCPGFWVGTLRIEGESRGDLGL